MDTDLRDLVARNGQTYDLEWTGFNDIDRQLLASHRRVGRDLYHQPKGNVDAPARYTPSDARRVVPKTTEAADVDADPVVVLRTDLNAAIQKFTSKHTDASLRRLLVTTVDELMDLVEQHVRSSRL